MTLSIALSLHHPCPVSKTKSQKNDKKDAHSRNRTEDLLISDTFGLRVRRCTTKPNGRLEVIASPLAHLIKHPSPLPRLNFTLPLCTFPHRIWTLTRATAWEVKGAYFPDTRAPWHHDSQSQGGYMHDHSPISPEHSIAHTSLRGNEPRGYYRGTGNGLRGDGNVMDGQYRDAEAHVRPTTRLLVEEAGDR